MPDRGRSAAQVSNDAREVASLRCFSWTKRFSSRLICLSFGLLTIAHAESVEAREVSRTLPQITEAVSTGVPYDRPPLWSRTIDGPPDSSALSTAHDSLAIGPRMVSFAVHGRMCGFAASSGKQLWCDAPGQAPAFASGAVAYAARDGSLRVVDAMSGRRRWNLASARAVWPAGQDFLIARKSIVMPNVQIGDPTIVPFEERSSLGRVVWNGSTPQYGGFVSLYSGYALRSVTYSGATMGTSTFVMRLGSGGGMTSVLDDAWEIVDFRPPIVMYSRNVWGEVQDHFLVCEISPADLRTGKVTATYRFEPDYDRHYASYQRNEQVGGDCIHGMSLDGRDLYIWKFPGEIYRYDFADGSKQRPALIESGGRFLGGPYRRWLYVARKDGVWSLRIDGARVRARRVIASADTPSAVTVAGNRMYVSFENGRIIGLDPQTGAQRFSARPCRPSATSPGIGSGPRGPLYVVCSLGDRWKLSAFDVN